MKDYKSTNLISYLTSKILLLIIIYNYLNISSFDLFCLYCLLVLKYLFVEIRKKFDLFILFLKLANNE